MKIDEIEIKKVCGKKKLSGLQVLFASLLLIVWLVYSFVAASGILFFAQSRLKYSAEDQLSVIFLVAYFAVAVMAIPLYFLSVRYLNRNC